MNTAFFPNKKLRIALLGYRSHPHVGGQGIYLHYLSRALHNAGHEVVVFSGPPYPELVDEVALIKVPSLDLYAKKSPLLSLRWANLFSIIDLTEWFSKLSGGFAEPATFGQRLLKQHSKELAGFDILHDNQSLCDALIQLQNKHNNVVATLHHPIHQDRNLAVKSAKDWLHIILTKRWYSFLKMQERVVPRLKHIVTVSQQSAADIESHFHYAKEELKVIPNGIDTSIFKPGNNANIIPGRIITTASSDHPLKGLRFLVDALASARTTNPHLHLRVIGKLKINGDIDKQIRNLGLEKSVDFLTKLSTEELVNEYQRAEIAVCPSLYEGFGIPALEAMACGIPLVSSSGGALPEVVGDAGVLVEPGNSAALSSAISKFTENAELRRHYSQRALRHVNKHFCWNKIAEEYVRYYQSVITANAYC